MNTPENKDLVLAKKQIKGMDAMINETQVTNDEELAGVADKIKKVKTLAKFIKQRKEAYTEPAKAIINEARMTFDPLLKKCDEAETELKLRARRYMTLKEQERIKEEQKIAARVEKGTLKPETAVRKMEALPEAPKTVKTDTGSTLRMATRRVAKIVNPSLIPAEYRVIDEPRVRRDALARDKANLEQIPGVEIVEETGLSSY